MPDRRTRRFHAGCLAAALLWCQAVGAVELNGHPMLASIVDDLVDSEGLDRETLQNWLASAEYKQSVIDTITRPAEALPWHRYRPLLINDAQVRSGVAFMEKYADPLGRAVERYGVDPHIITAIIGIETRFGTIKGNYRVIDSLATLSVGYPKRSEFFSKELREYLLLASTNGLDPLTTKGSYAGAIGIPQFMPSSYIHYSVDFNDDGVRDLVDDYADAIGSVANYLDVHKWRRGEPVVALLGRGASDKLLDSLETRGAQPDVDIDELKVRGLDVTPEQAGWKVGVIRLEQEHGFDYRVGYPNFFAILTYNPRFKYAMAVWELAEAIRERR